ncbi:MAG TPA: hypothetical protein VFQ61_06545 [Polyangiaceae bacterium]|nr:hypothetical protein [Polyangiaceae bacterium]
MGSTTTTQNNTKRATPEVKIEKFSRNLRVELTEAEINERAQRAAHLLQERDRKDEENKAASKHAKAQVAEIEAELRRVSSEIRDGATYKEVACERRHNYRLGNIQEVRMDTKDVIAERAMNDRERQLDLTLNGSNGASNGSNGNGASAHAEEGDEQPNSVQVLEASEGGAENDSEYEPEPPLETQKPQRARRSRKKP